MRNDMRPDMRTDDVEVPLPGQSPSFSRDSDTAHDASLGELFRRLTSDTTDLLRQEVDLAKAEVRETGSRLAKTGTTVGIGAGLAIMGGLSLTAFLVIALGNVLGGRYWLSSLLVGVVAAGAGYAMITGALRAFGEHGVVPQRTVETLKEDAAWAKQEARAFKHELTTSPDDANASMNANASSIRP